MLKISKEHLLYENSEDYFRRYHSCSLPQAKKKKTDVCQGSNYQMRMGKTQLFPKLKKNQFGNILKVKQFFLSIPDDSIFLHEGKGERTFMCYDSERRSCPATCKYSLSLIGWSYQYPSVKQSGGLALLPQGQPDQGRTVEADAPGGQTRGSSPPDLALSHCHGVTSSERAVVSVFVFKAVDIFISVNVEHHIKKD